MDLANDVYAYYTDHLAELTDDKRFHFATRMLAWRGDPAMRAILEQSRVEITKSDQPLNKTIGDILATEQTGRRNAHELRQPYFEKYPLLYGVHAALFRVRHLQEVYGIDAKQALLDHVPIYTLNDLESKLIDDQPAVKILSTFAINFAYLFEGIIKVSWTSLSPTYFYKIGQTYDTSDPIQLQLLIYLYTHCIIGASNFYVRPINDIQREIFKSMLAQLEPLILEHFTDINLDNKLEFLVCSRMVGYTSTIDQAVYDECNKSVSPDGTFLIDIHNTNGQDDRNDFNKSEHRNVLFIMSTSDYTPHSTLL